MNQSNIISILTASIVAGLVAFTTVKVLPPTSGDSQSIQLKTLENAISTGVIRCGYVTYPPGLIKDPNTGEISGIFPEVLEKAAENLGLKVEWVEEVGWGTMVEGLKAGRFDMIGSPVWPTAQRIRVADFSAPIYFGGAEAFVREDDDRFDNGLATVNDPQIRIATTDGEVTDSIAQQDFPKAERVSLPQLTDLSQLLLTVADGKADITFAEPHIAYEFMKNNPGKIKAARPGDPVRLYPNTMMLQQEDATFRRAINLAIEELQNSGVVDQILKKYEPFPGAFYRNASPIQNVSEQ